VNRAAGFTRIVVERLDLLGFLGYCWCCRGGCDRRLGAQRPQALRDVQLRLDRAGETDLRVVPIDARLDGDRQVLAGGFVEGERRRGVNLLAGGECRSRCLYPLDFVRGGLDRAGGYAELLVSTR
jgi:hypothetical protein